ncbi:deubiquitinase OTUD6B [Lepeophtheirus salmonis]|uniref:OTU domain containing 6B [Equus caballus] n=1 Tax=Lepeophtheirus salmonis TaxID=72036 RepID=A0A0K2UYR6_LEPSM|nr:deubiquitinase OTUD6B-like [Lepeophtheirus salmonis]
MTSIQDHEEPELSPLEKIKKKHRKEKKELQAQIQSIKKCASKGDKKKKKESLEEITQLEKDLELKHSNELQLVKETDESILEEISTPEAAPAPGVNPKMSKAQKKRKEKERKEKDREEEIKLAAEMNQLGVRQVEIDKLKDILSNRGLRLKDIPADGDCMFSAIADQVRGQTVKSLRLSAAKRLRESMTEVLPFLTNANGKILSPTEFETYCSDLESKSDIWGGQVELNALSHVLERQIEVIQAEGTPILLGEDYEDIVILAYHRHMYGLGEHYNSVEAL